MRLEFEAFERLREAISTARRNDDDVRLSVELADKLLLAIGRSDRSARRRGGPGMKVLCVGGPMHGTLFELPNPPGALRTVWFAEPDYRSGQDDPPTYVLQKYWIPGTPLSERYWALTYADNGAMLWAEVSEARSLAKGDGDPVEESAP